ncbi:MAG: tyrosine-type recombinase/integrase [Alphaproteobacteria bacterium]|nr:tyrosine-type recombinase/integrase [Alphaproteobacteria bacterium]
MPNVNKIRGRRQADGSRRVYYYHRPTGLRLPDDPTSPEFAARLRELNGDLDRRRNEPGMGTLAHAITAYRASPDFTGRAAKTKKDYIRYLDFLKEKLGDLQLASIDREAVLALRDELAGKARTADYTVAILRKVLSYAGDRPRAFLLPQSWSNPAAKPGRLARPKGHRPWEEYEIAAFEKAWRHGTIERTTFALYLNTGQRGGDIPKTNRHHIAAKQINVCQEKTGERVWIPLSDDLSRALRAWMKGKGKDRVYVLAGKKGEPMGVDYLRHMMRDAIRGAGLPDDCTLHGLRVSFAVRAHEWGLSWEAIADVCGWETMEMARKYIRRHRRSRAVITGLDEANRARREDRNGNVLQNTADRAAKR